MKHIAFLFCLSLLSCIAFSQPYTVFVDSLRLPAGIEADALGRLWITESGYGFDDGAVILVEPDGTHWPVIVGLPSFFDTTTQENVGPWHTLMLPGNKIAVAEGASGQVLIFDLAGFAPGIGAPLPATAHVAALDISTFVLSQGFVESNPYSIARDAAGNLYVADAAANAVIKASATGQLSIFATFPGFPNPLPFGPPTVDAVPTRILAKPGGGFYVSQLTGFPFLDNAANVFFVDADGLVTLYATGLTQLTDLALDANTGDLYALQVGKFVLDPMLPPGYAPNSAKVTRIKTNGDREIAAENFDLSAGMALDGQGNLFTTQLGKGNLLKWNGIATAVQEQASGLVAMRLSPNPAGAVAQITFSLKEDATVHVRILAADGRTVFEQHPGQLACGAHRMHWQASDCKAGLYWVEIRAGRDVRVQALVLE